jgi:hypothetical protein
VEHQFGASDSAGVREAVGAELAFRPAVPRFEVEASTASAIRERDTAKINVRRRITNACYNRSLQTAV